MGKKRIIKETAEEVSKEAGADKGPISDEKKTSLKGTKASQAIKHGRIYVSASYNNVLVTATDDKGNALAWASSGGAGFKGPKKATPFAASKCVENLFEKLAKTSFEDVSIYINGIGGGRDAVLRALVGRGLPISAIRDITPVAHNGCRPRKVRRV